MKSDLDSEMAFAAAVEEGRTDMQEGRTASHDEVAACFKRVSGRA